MSPAILQYPETGTQKWIAIFKVYFVWRAPKVKDGSQQSSLEFLKGKFYEKPYDKL